jgi:hypothetical protein
MLPMGNDGQLAGRENKSGRHKIQWGDAPVAPTEKMNSILYIVVDLR